MGMFSRQQELLHQAVGAMSTFHAGSQTSQQTINNLVNTFVADKEKEREERAKKDAEAAADRNRAWEYMTKMQEMMMKMNQNNSGNAPGNPPA